MITKKRFNRIKPYDFLLFKNGKIRMVLPQSKEGLLVFQSLRPGKSSDGKYSYYLYSDIYKKIRGIWRIHGLFGMM